MSEDPEEPDDTSADEGPGTQPASLADLDVDSASTMRPISTRAVFRPRTRPSPPRNPPLNPRSAPPPRGYCCRLRGGWVADSSKSRAYQKSIRWKP